MIRMSDLRTAALAVLFVVCTVLLPARTAVAGDPTGSCEFDDGAYCAQLTQVQCDLFGDAVYLGDGTTCDLPVGACRIESIGFCDLFPGTFCTDQLGGTYDGDGTFCSEVGGCCLPSLRCQGELSQDECEAMGGLFLGIGQSCPESPGDDFELCPRPGACCLPDGTCEDLSHPNECASLGGFWLGFESTCEPQACVGACCVGDDDCMPDVSITDCAAAGGTFLGVGSSCLGACPVETHRAWFDERRFLIDDEPVALPAFDDANGLRRLDAATLEIEVRHLDVPVYTNQSSAPVSPEMTWAVTGAISFGPGMPEGIELLDCSGTETCCDEGACLPPGGQCDFGAPLRCSGATTLSFSDPADLAYFLADPSFTLDIDATAGSGGGEYGFDASRRLVEVRHTIAYAYTPLGACCLCDGTCVLLPEPACAAQGGIFRGVGVPCEEADCEPFGACCLCDGTCVDETTEADCLAQGGRWQGACTECGDLAEPCEPFGACCFCDGTCSEVTEAECIAGGGTWQGACTDCEPELCPVIGACCLCTGVCLSDVTEADCLAQGGSWNGACSSCDDVECRVLGACCFCDGTCTDTTQEDCLAAGGTFQGACTSCASVTCDPTGACCLCDGNCTPDLTEAECAALDGTWNGACSTCADADCPVLGACCLCDGTCLDTTREDCLAQGGDFQGACSECDDLTVPCAELGACCLCDGTCEITSETACDLQGGLWQGACTECGDLAEPCEPFGSCCLCDNTCIEGVTETECFENPDAVAFTPCGDCSECVVTGTCCLCTGECLADVTEAFCTAEGGDFIGGCASCEEVACEEVGACCLCDGTCDILEKATCLARGGDFIGRCTTCEDVECAPIGACCLCDASCMELTEVACEEMGGVWSGECTACGSGNYTARPVVECVEFGACCFCDGDVGDFYTEAECVADGGDWLGACSDSDNATCDAYGSCCLFFTDGSDSICLERLTLAECQAEADAAGAFPVFEIGACSPCQPYCNDDRLSCFLLSETGYDCEDFGFRTYDACVPCTDPNTQVGACCIPGMPCVQAPEINCVYSGGTFLGLGSSCPEDGCFDWIAGGEPDDQGASPLLVVLEHLGPCPADGTCRGDLNGDGVVDGLDIVLAATREQAMTDAARRASADD